MARKKCDFVKGAKAAWHCERCNVNYSEQCIPDGYNPQWGRQGPTCLLCHSPLHDLDDPSAYLPFWQVVPYLLIYPLHINALLLMLIGAGGVYLVGGGTPGYIYSIIFSIVSIKYLLCVITQRGEGRRWAPSLIELAKPDPHYLFLQLVLIYILLAVGILAASILVSIKVGLMTAIFLALAWPASTIILATEKNVFKAVNPLRLFGVMASLGIGPYAAMWLMTLAIGVGPGVLSYFLEPRLEDQWVLPVFSAVGIYFSLVLHALLGYVLFQYRSELDANYEQEESTLGEDAFRKARLLGAVTVFESKGDDNRLREPMRDLLDVCRDDITVHQKYQALLMRLNDPDALAKHTDYLLGLMLDKKQNTEALTLVKEVYAHSPEYRMRHAGTALRMATVLAKKKEYRLLVQITANLHKRVAPSNDVAAVYKIVAEALAGPLAEPAKAKAVATCVIKTYPKAAEVKALAKLARSL